MIVIILIVNTQQTFGNRQSHDILFGPRRYCASPLLQASVSVAPTVAVRHWDSLSSLAIFIRRYHARDDMFFIIKAVRQLINLLSGRSVRETCSHASRCYAVLNGFCHYSPLDLWSRDGGGGGLRAIWILRKPFEITSAKVYGSVRLSLVFDFNILKIKSRSREEKFRRSIFQKFLRLINK